MTDTTLNSPPVPSIAQKWKSIWSGFRVHRPSQDAASYQMLSLARTNLGVRLDAIDATSLMSDCQKKIYKTVTEMLNPSAESRATAQSFEWDDIYKAESLIALLYSGEQLRRAVNAGLEDLAAVDQAAADNFTRDNEELLKRPTDGSTPASDECMRAFLLRILEAAHWNAKKKYLARPLRAQATNRILVCLLVSFVLLIAPYGFLVSDFSQGIVREAWTLFALYTALTAGLLGAFCSRLYGIQRQWGDMSLDEVSLQREWTYTLLRAGVGVCGALIVYIFLRSGIAEGALFPKFDEIKIELVNVDSTAKDTAVHMAFAMPSKALALLTFWCFLAGISETLVPSILKSTEQELTNAVTQASGK